MNSVSLIGRLSKEPDTRYTSGSNTAVTSFSIAVNRDFKKEGQPDADFLNIVTWGKTAEFAGKYFTKGLQVGVLGRLQVRTYDDNQGKKHYITEVVADRVYFADGKKNTTQRQVQSDASDNGFYPMDDDPDSLPF